MVSGVSGVTPPPDRFGSVGPDGHGGTRGGGANFGRSVLEQQAKAAIVNLQTAIAKLSTEISTLEAALVKQAAQSRRTAAEGSATADAGGSGATGPAAGLEQYFGPNSDWSKAYQSSFKSTMGAFLGLYGVSSAFSLLGFLGFGLLAGL